MAEELVVGSNATPTGGLGATNYAYCGRFQAGKSATGVTKFFAYGGDSTGNVKIGVYSDVASHASARLGYNDTGQSLVAGQWNELSISSMNVVSGNWYWLCMTTGTGNCIKRTDTGGSSGLDAATYATWSWSDPLGLDIGDGDTAYIMPFYLLGETGGGGSSPSSSISSSPSSSPSSSVSGSPSSSPSSSPSASDSNSVSLSPSSSISGSPSSSPSASVSSSPSSSQSPSSSISGSPSATPSASISSSPSSSPSPSSSISGSPSASPSGGDELDSIYAYRSGNLYINTHGMVSLKFGFDRNTILGI